MMSERIGQDWQRLARLVVHWRVRRGYRKQTEFADASGIKIRTLNNIENARQTGYDPTTIALLEQGLDWLPGSVDAVLAGGDPELADGPPQRARLTVIDTQARVLLLTEEIEELRRDLAVAERFEPLSRGTRKYVVRWIQGEIERREEQLAELQSGRPDDRGVVESNESADAN